MITIRIASIEHNSVSFKMKEFQTDAIKTTTVTATTTTTTTAKAIFSIQSVNEFPELRENNC